MAVDRMNAVGSELKRDTANLLRSTASTLEEAEITMHEIASRRVSRTSDHLDELANLASARAAEALRQAERLDEE